MEDLQKEIEALKPLRQPVTVYLYIHSHDWMWIGAHATTRMEWHALFICKICGDITADSGIVLHNPQCYAETFRQMCTLGKNHDGKHLDKHGVEFG